MLGWYGTTIHNSVLLPRPGRSTHLADPTSLAGATDYLYAPADPLPR